MHDFLIDSFLPFAIMAILIIAGLAWLARLLLFFYNRYKDRNKKENPFEKKETMGLPKGAMRTFFALSFTAIAILAVLSDSVLGDAADKQWILGELGVIITFYFGSKAVEAYANSKSKD